jgi:hypothetical protein
MKMIKNDLKNTEKHSEYLVSLLIQLGLTHSGMLYSVPNLILTVFQATRL